MSSIQPSQWRIALLNALILMVGALIVGLLTGFAVQRWESQTPPLVLSSRVTERADAPLPERLDAASAERIRQHLKVIAHDIGVRPAGSRAEEHTARYVEKQFKACGYEVTVQRFPLPNGKTSQNVIAWTSAAPRRNYSRPVLLLGAHIDTKPTTPGASDNASGVALLLELARALALVSSPVEVVFVAFGAEEIIDRNPDHHHYGSRHLVRHMPEIRNLALERSEGTQHATRNLTMISLDMIGIGTRLHISSLGKPWSVRLVRALYALARQQGIPAVANRAPPWSDHEPFEKVGVPAAWLHWEKNPHYHRRGDTYDKMDVGKIVSVGNVVLSYLRDQAGKTVTLAAVGDLLPEPSWRTHCPPLAHLLADVRDLLFSADIAFANLESPLTTSPFRTPHKSAASIARKRNWVFKARRPDAATGLAHSGVTIVSLANNHSLDYQVIGLRETMSKLKAAGVAWCGAGENYRVAFAPAFVTVGDVTFAFIAAAHSSSTPRGFFAAAERFGVASADDLPRLLESVRRARARADVVAVSLHWGIEKKPFPEKWQRQMAHRLVDAGADLILGHHPHVLQGVEQYKGKPILYSLGNFVFDSVPSHWHSAIAFITYDPTTQDLSLDMLPIRIYPHGRVAPATGSDAQEIRRQLYARSQPLNSSRPSFLVSGQ